MKKEIGSEAKRVKVNADAQRFLNVIGSEKFCYRIDEVPSALELSDFQHDVTACQD